MTAFIRFLARQKFRFDLGAGFMQVINFCFIVIAASDKIFTLTGIPARVLIPASVIVGVLAVWFVGYVLDRMRYPNAYQNEQNLRNKMLTDALKGKE